MFSAPKVEEAAIEALSKVEKMKAIELRHSLMMKISGISIARFYAIMAALADDEVVEMWDEPHEQFQGARVYWYKLIGRGRRTRKRNRLLLGLRSLLPHPAMS
jgi:hypothetical protein